MTCGWPHDTRETPQNQNQKGLHVKRKTDNTSPGGWGLIGGDWSQTLTREVNLKISDISTEEVRESGRGFQSLIIFVLAVGI